MLIRQHWVRLIERWRSEAEKAGPANRPGSHSPLRQGGTGSGWRSMAAANRGIEACMSSTRPASPSPASTAARRPTGWIPRCLMRVFLGRLGAANGGTAAWWRSRRAGGRRRQAAQPGAREPGRREDPDHQLDERGAGPAWHPRASSRGCAEGAGEAGGATHAGGRCRCRRTCWRKCGAT